MYFSRVFSRLYKQTHTHRHTDVYYSKFEPKQTNNKTHNLKIGNKVNMGLQNLGLTYLLVPSLFFFFLKLRLLASESDSNLYGFLTPPSSSSKRNSHS